MAIRTVVTRGFGNGTFNGTIPLAVTRGYAIGEAVVETFTRLFPRNPYIKGQAGYQILSGNNYTK